MSCLKKATFTLLAASGMVAAGAGLANADASNVAVGGGSDGVVAGFIMQNAQDQPLTNCGNTTMAWISVLTGSEDNTCTTSR